eukprot:TRINITY_DN7643_c0_g1_i1.p1 TRINITY_DN7643_c0_g1~~TRINITY_DN7643_c0_g1_i1.p1  ORF type:complete len:691 (-),score=128.07 TRINITY_DN7643_c0_g1_i1:187-2259(-)
MGCAQAKAAAITETPKKLPTLLRNSSYEVIVASSIQSSGYGSASEQKKKGGDMASRAGKMPTKIEKTEERGITLMQLAHVMEIIEARCSTWVEKFEGSPDFGKTLVARKVNLYQTNDNVIKPSTKVYRCSYVELVASEAQAPAFFVSHWWGEPVFLFLGCLRQHACLRHLAVECAYWVCAYANNQWELSAEIQQDPSRTSFRKAMALSVGTVSVVDAEAETFRRIWCSYEVATTLMKDEGKLYDVVTMLPSSGTAVVLSDGLTEEDELKGKQTEWEHRGGAQGYKLSREKAFPRSVFDRAFGVCLEEGQASQEADRIHILNSIAGRGLDLAPLAEHKNYNLANRILRWRFGMGFLAIAEELGEIDECKLLEMPEPPLGKKVISEYQKLGRAFETLSRLRLALAMYEKLLAVQRKTLGDTDPSVGETYYNMALVYGRQSKYDLALEHYEKALSIYLKALGDAHPNVGETYNGMAVVYKDQSKYDLALEYYAKALSIYLKALGAAHPNVGDAYNNMAILYKNRSKYDLALEYYEKALSIKLNALGDAHPSVGDTYDNMAIVYQNQSKCDLALEYYEKALSIYLKALGAAHPNVGDAYNNMAILYKNLSKYDLALVYYEKALSIKLNALGAAHPSVGDTYHNMAVVYQKQSKCDLALEYYEKAAAVYEVAYSESHPQAVDARERMAALSVGMR